MFRRKTLITICFIFCMITPLLKTHMAEAHSGSVGYSDITIKGNKMNYHLFLYADLLGGLLNIDKNQDGDMTAEEIAQSKPAIEQFINQRLSIKNNGKKGQLHIKHINLTERSNLTMFRIEMEDDFNQPIKEFKIDYNLFYDGVDVNHQNFATIMIGDKKIEHIFTKEKNSLKGNAISSSSKSQNEILGFWDYVVMGMKHIWSGIDHLLFLFGLLMARGTMRDYLKTLTAFTVGHCITLALAATETLIISSSIIEPLIALSIVYVAAENIWGKSFKWRWLVALFFGLIHGFGFAELLIGKLGNNFIFPLFSFNFGIEIGQIVVLLIMFPVIWYLRKGEWKTKVVYSVSSMISVVGLYWFVERMINLNL